MGLRCYRFGCFGRDDLPELDLKVFHTLSLVQGALALADCQ
jgi:hypothetical protein